jgi:rRNA maturation endonuclease Nob1
MVRCDAHLSTAALNIWLVIQFAKKTGDYTVLSHADLSVLALTYDLHKQYKAESEKKALETVRSYVIEIENHLTVCGLRLAKLHNLQSQTRRLH